MMSSTCWWMGPGLFFGGPFGTIIGFVFWILSFYGIFYLISSLIKKSSNSVQNNVTPMEILKNKYARGEIDEEDFTKRKSILTSKKQI